ncbi:hypothetical protein OS493_034637 [Desmophyllum pertusum]|uniref:Uncharacterized protein n=1 Tax=Desmophyllum pertusum TaxID=174260 RepID=A0A9W9ZJ38_9CNID|nr:hypothetical protein OS493_034637 [Desmophyllum pertusum]
MLQDLDSRILFHSSVPSGALSPFDTRTVVVHTSADEPVTAIARLKLKQSGNSSVSVGRYRLSGDQSSLPFIKQFTADSHNQSQKSMAKSPPSPIMEQDFHIELQISVPDTAATHISSHGSIMLSIRHTGHLGQTVCSQFDLRQPVSTVVLFCCQKFQ